MFSINGKNVHLHDEELLRKEADNTSYMKELDNNALLQNFYQEAGRYQNFGSKATAHGGWEDPTCQLRGHFLGHWLSAVAMHYNATGNEELLAKANAIVHELRLCQIDNGGQWVASIPEKYFYWIAKGKAVWAPHYNVHKTFMGLLDMYRYTKSSEALEIAVNFAQWFYSFTNDKTMGELDDILDFETGGMLEVWADLYSFTKDSMYLTLIERYDRRRLFNPLLEGEDVLTNMHANTTIPEVIGAARVYEETGLERYRDIALAYWKCAVTERGTFVTGGQTLGEIWTPPHSMAARLGEKNQEHCTVYNMVRLADILFRWTKKPEYADYIEKNICNGIMAQGYYRGGHSNGQTPDYPEEGLITYFLPLHAGGHKGWGSKTQDFYCCHGTLVQANAAHNNYIYYQEENNIYVAQYFASDAVFDVSGKLLTIRQYRDTLSGSSHFFSMDSATQSIRKETHIYQHQPDCMLQCFKLECDEEIEFTLNLRIPSWVRKAARLIINNVEQNCKPVPGAFTGIRRVWRSGDIVMLYLPLSVTATLLEGTDDMVAFSYGPIVLAGLCNDERLLHTHGNAPETLLVHDCEREWGSWKQTFKTRMQEHGIRFVPLKDIGYERYQVYFPTD